MFVSSIVETFGENIQLVAIFPNTGEESDLSLKIKQIKRLEYLGNFMCQIVK